MRLFFLFAAILLTACQQAEERSAEPSPGRQPIVTYAGIGRDRLCLDEGAGRIGLITYGQGDVNCSVRGGVTRSAGRLSISPDGDESCRIDATLAGARLTLGGMSPSCAYYCGPDASYADKSFGLSDNNERVVDLAGDPLC